MLMLLAILIPVVGAVLVFRTEDAAKRRRLCAASIVSAWLCATLAIIPDGSDITLLRLSDTLSLRFAFDGLSLFFVNLVGCI